MELTCTVRPIPGFTTDFPQKLKLHGNNKVWLNQTASLSFSFLDNSKIESIRTLSENKSKSNNNYEIWMRAFNLNSCEFSSFQLIEK